MDKLKEFLLKDGWSEDEIQVYVSCLVMGDTTVLKISRHAKVKRGTTYNILNKLVGLGYVSSHQTRKSINYFASNPKKILTTLKNKLELAEEFLPIASQFYKEDKDESRVHVGTSGGDYENAINPPLDTLKSGNELLVFGNVTHFLKNSKDAANEWFKVMKNRKHKARVLIYGDDENVVEFLERCKGTNNPYLKYRVIKSPIHSVFTETAITNDKVIIFTGDRKFNIVTFSSEKMVLSYRQFFEQLWRDGEEVKN